MRPKDASLGQLNGRSAALREEGRIGHGLRSSRSKELFSDQTATAMELSVQELSALKTISAQLNGNNGLLLLFCGSGQINAKSVGDLSIGEQRIRRKSIWRLKLSIKFGLFK